MQALIVALQLGDLLGGSELGGGFPPPPLGRQGMLALAAPGAQVRRIQPLSTQQRPDLAQLGTAVGFLQNALFVGSTELPALSLFGHFRIGPFDSWVGYAFQFYGLICHW